MDEKLKQILFEYIKDVEVLCEKLLEGISFQESIQLRNKLELFKYLQKTQRKMFEVNGINYRLHGVGCFAIGNDVNYNWDFGYRSRWCGIDPWRVAITLRNCSKYENSYDGEYIAHQCDQAVTDGRMFFKNNQYYFTIPRDETFSPNFPRLYDSLIINRYDSQWIIPRNNNIDRFIKKSTWVSTCVKDNKNSYLLSFVLNGKEIYSIEYDDIGYPENAIKIMSDVILRNLL